MQGESAAAMKTEMAAHARPLQAAAKTRIEVGVSKATQPKAFTLADRELLRTLMAKSFQEKKFDQGYLDNAPK